MGHKLVHPGNIEELPTPSDCDLNLQYNIRDVKVNLTALNYNHTSETSSWCLPIGTLCCGVNWCSNGKLSSTHGMSFIFILNYSSVETGSKKKTHKERGFRAS